MPPEPQHALAFELAISLAYHLLQNNIHLRKGGRKLSPPPVTIPLFSTTNLAAISPRRRHPGQSVNTPNCSCSNLRKVGLVNNRNTGKVALVAQFEEIRQGML
jgi:hypothetical protein